MAEGTHINRWSVGAAALIGFIGGALLGGVYGWLTPPPEAPSGSDPGFETGYFIGVLLFPGLVGMVAVAIAAAVRNRLMRNRLKRPD